MGASILGAVCGAHYTRAVAPAYGIPVFVHSDHCAKKLLPWFDGMLEADEEYFKVYGEPLFSSHMLDLSEEPHEENVATCAHYFKRMAPMNLMLEMEIGITGGVEDGVDNSGVAKDKLYSTPEDTKLSGTPCLPSQRSSRLPPRSGTSMACTSQVTSSCSQSCWTASRRTWKRSWVCQR